MTQIATLRPGLLVSLKTSIAGNVKYKQNVLEAEHVTDEGAKKALWETERTIVDPEEHEAAKKARTKARTLIVGVCAASAFGYLCPEADADKLAQAVDAARKVADDFNATAKLTRVVVNIIAGRIAADDVEAVRAINGEVRELLEDMQEGLKNCDVKVIREAANKAKELGAMLSREAGERVKVAIDTAREAAKKIVKAAETGAAEVDQAAIRKIAESRTAFLDLGEAAEVAAPTSEARAIDLTPIASPAPTLAAFVPEIEMDDTKISDEIAALKR